ncbi:MAG TPA: class I SAM-dependent methyltransferase, partial [Pyrinomonadaceae bacterium]
MQKQKAELLASPAIAARQKELLRNASAEIHYRDGMYTGDAVSYFLAGLSAIDCIEEVLRAGAPAAIQAVLDLPSGYGRELRFLVQRFPAAQFTACDIQPRAVEFCAREFGVAAVVSDPDLNRVSFAQTFDLIWCGSLITHLNAETIGDLLALFARHLNPAGLMIFTAHGDHVLNRMTREQAAYDLRPADLPALTDSYSRTGYGYHDYPRGQGYFDFHPKGTGYGISLTSPDLMRRQV